MALKKYTFKSVSFIRLVFDISSDIPIISRAMITWGATSLTGNATLVR
jgi:hypothetical protein